MTDLGANRHRKILTLIEEQANVRVADLVRQLDVSEETVRRDLKELEAQNLLRRVHGGAVPVTTMGLPTFASRASGQILEKNAIAAVAVAELAEGQNIFLGGGSTVYALAKRLPQCPRLRVVTPMMDTAIAAALDYRHEVNIPGGVFDFDNRVVNGPDVLQCVLGQYFDVVFLGISAIDVGRGMLDHNSFGPQLDRTLAARTHRVIVLADHTKFGKTARFCSLDFAAVHKLITDREPPPEFLSALRTAGVEVGWPEDGRS